MAMQALRDGSKGGILKFFLLGILCLAAGGLVFTDVGGFFRGGVSGTDVAKVGKDAVGINSFDRVARRTLAQLGMTPAQAYKLGYLDQILNSEIQRRLLMKAAQDSDVVVGKDYVVGQIQTILAPAIANGMSAEDALNNLLRGQGISESELTNTILSERTLTLFGNAMEAGALYVPTSHVEPIYQYNNETRNIRYLAFPHKDFADTQEPSDEQLMEMYERTKESFASPERRDIKVVTINTDKIADTLVIEDDILRDSYDDLIDSYTTPPTRKITQAVFTDEDSANAALENITVNNFSQIKGADIIPARNFEEDKMLDELKGPVFDASKTGIIGPIETPLGWTIVNLVAIEEESTQSFESVKEDIRKDIIAEQLIDEIYKLVDEVDEFFAIGGSVEEAKEQFDFEIESFNGLTAYGQNKDGKSPLNPALGPDAQTVLQSAYELDEGTTGPAFELSNGRFVAINTAAVTPKSYKPFEEIKDQLKQSWIEDNRAFNNRVALIDLQKQNAETPIEDVAKQESKSFKTVSEIKRDDDNSPLSPSARVSIFGAKKGEHFIIEIRDGIALAEVTNITKPIAPKDADIETLQSKTQQEMQNELLVLYINKMQEKYPSKINERLLEQVYGEQSDSF